MHQRIRFKLAQVSEWHSLLQFGDAIRGDLSILTNAEYVQDGRVTDAGIAQLKERMSFADSLHHSNRPTVLIVDDQPQVLDFARHVLTHRGLNVIVADGGKKGFECLEECQDTIECILLDVVMPDFGAAEFIDAMSQKNINVPIVLMSGYSNHRVAEFISHANVIGILEKPFPISELVGAISTALAIARGESGNPSLGQSFVSNGSGVS